MDTLAMIKDTLWKLTEVHERLLQLAMQKKESLMNGDITVLQSIINSESACIERVQHLEQERIQQVQRYFNEKEINVNTLTLRSLIETLTEGVTDKTLLENESKNLLSIIDKIKVQNEQNKLLLQTSLYYVQYSLSFLIKKEPSIGYGPRSSKGNSSLLDARI